MSRCDELDRRLLEHPDRRPVGSRSIRPIGGSGVSAVIPASSSAREFTHAPWPSRFVQEDRPVGDDRVEGLAPRDPAGERLHRPAVTDDPLALRVRRGIGGHGRDVARPRESNRSRSHSTWRSPPDTGCVWASVNPGTTVRPRRSTTRVRGSRSDRTSRSRPSARIRSPRRRRPRRRCRPVQRPDAPAVEDQVRAAGRGWHRRNPRPGRRLRAVGSRHAHHRPPAPCRLRPRRRASRRLRHPRPRRRRPHRRRPRDGRLTRAHPRSARGRSASRPRR